MTVYKVSADDLLKIKQLEQYSFLHDNAKYDHGTHWTITLSGNSRAMLVEKLGIELAFVHAIDHLPASGNSIIIPEAAPPQDSEI